MRLAFLSQFILADHPTNENRLKKLEDNFLLSGGLESRGVLWEDQLKETDSANPAVEQNISSRNCPGNKGESNPSSLPFNNLISVHSSRI
jgi:hypothetical protein